MSRKLLFVLNFVFLLHLYGCGPNREPLPTYKWTDSQTVLRILSERSHAVRSITASVLMRFSAPNGQSINLEGAVALAPPAKCARLQAWKFNQKVFDLTLTPDGLWIEGNSDVNRSIGARQTSGSAPAISQVFSMLDGDFFDGADMHVRDLGGTRFFVAKPLDDEHIVFAEIDRATLTVLEYKLAYRNTVRLRLALSQYVDLHGTVWPTRLLAVSPDGKIEIDLRDIELNRDIAPTAFVPPPGAKKAS